jgi:hypothetical protein
MFWSDDIPVTYAPASGFVSTANTPYYLSVGRTNSVPVYYNNGVAGAAVGSNFNLNGDDPILVGSGTGLGTENFGGRIYAILIYDAMMSDADRQTIQTWLAGLYGL